MRAASGASRRARARVGFVAHAAANVVGAAAHARLRHDATRTRGRGTSHHPSHHPLCRARAPGPARTLWPANCRRHRHCPGSSRCRPAGSPGFRENRPPHGRGRGCCSPRSRSCVPSHPQKLVVHVTVRARGGAKRRMATRFRAGRAPPADTGLAACRRVSGHGKVEVHDHPPSASAAVQGSSAGCFGGGPRAAATPEGKGRKGE